MKRLVSIIVVLALVAVSQAGVVAHYGMGEIEGGAGTPATLIDDIGGVNGALISGTPTIVAEGAVAGSTHSMLFNGGNDRYETATNPLGTDHYGPTSEGWTVEVWAKPTADHAAGGAVDLVLTHGHGGAGYCISADGNQWSLFVGGSGFGTLEAGSSDFTLNEWHHLVMTKDPTVNGGAATLFVNGVQASQHGFVHWVPVVDQFGIGNQVTGGHGFTGQIDEVTLTAIPEPATMMLLGLGGLLFRRKK